MSLAIILILSFTFGWHVYGSIKNRTMDKYWADREYLDSCCAHEANMMLFLVDLELIRSLNIGRKADVISTNNRHLWGIRSDHEFLDFLRNDISSQVVSKYVNKKRFLQKSHT